MASHWPVPLFSFSVSLRLIQRQRHQGAASSPLWGFSSVLFFSFPFVYWGMYLGQNWSTGASGTLNFKGKEGSEADLVNPFASHSPIRHFLANS